MNKVELKKTRTSPRANAYYVTVTDGNTVRELFVHTNSNGEGLWIDGKQILGLAQFRFSSPNNYRRYFRDYTVS